MPFPDSLTPPDTARMKRSKVYPVGAMELEELHEREYPEFKIAVEASRSITLGTTSPIENCIQKKGQRQDLERSYREANVSTNGYGLTKEEMKAYRESSDDFEKILAAHAASVVIPYVVDLEISFAEYTKLVSARNSISGKLPVDGNTLLESLIFLERWSRLATPVFSNTGRDPTIDKWIENIRNQYFALRGSAQWGPLYKLYEQWAVDGTDFYSPQYASFESLDFDSY